ncbi:hypothetical protein QJ527_08385 [Enterococcus mundtii]|uniref:hypothetical protein n=1 Tax=Enterococcus TaxID=1350 RepID=UPI000557BA2A|nr:MULTISPECIES: hypothetical protein [Enterococcus]AZP92513.1 hypothetical protein CYK55_05085 [Enterococcus mundtii]MDK4211549.1 hypothetical protein [Enterococcus mundtii]MDO7879846.1 hypothetical protein [Enterococcus mundtii]MEC3941306.1 hypothetical protein [Enterococcus mundtii]
MFKKQTFETNVYMKLFRLAYSFLAGNLCLLLVNLPFFLVVVTTAIDIRNSLFFLGSLFFFLPAIMTTFVWFVEGIQENEAPVKTFFQLYRWVWKKSMYLGGSGYLVIAISFVDILFFKDQPIGIWLIPLFFIFIILAINLMINNFYFQVKNPEISIREIYHVSFYYVLKKWYISLLNTILVFLLLIVMVVKPQFGFLVTPCLFLGLIYLNCKQTYRYLNKNQ